MQSIIKLCIVLFLLGNVSSQSLTGNEQLKDAVNAALAEIFVNKEWIGFSQSFPVGLRTQDCPASTDYFSYPTTPTGTLLNILNQGKITIGVSFSFPPLSFVNTGGQLDGFDVQLFNRVAERIGAHYGKTFTISWLNTDGGNFFTPVLNGTADAFIGAIIPGLYDSVHKLTTSQVGNLACSHVTIQIGLLAGPSFTATHASLSISDLNNANLKVGSFATSDSVRAEIVREAPNSNIKDSQYWAPDYDTLFSWLASGQVDVITTYSTTIDYKLAQIANTSSYISTTLPVEFLKGFVARRDQGQAAADDRVTATDGHKQLYYAFQASLSNFYASGKWDTLSGNYGVGSRLENCVPNSTFYSYPSNTNLLAGNLLDVINNKKLNICYSNTAPYLYIENGVTKGFYNDIIANFVSDLQTQYTSGQTINVEFLLALDVPVFSALYNNTCHAFVGAVIPGSLGQLEGVFTTTAQKTFQSCAIHNDAVVILAGPAFTSSFSGDLTVDSLNTATTTLTSVQSSTSARNYAQTIFPNAKIDITTQDNSIVFQNLRAGTTKLMITQRVAVENFLSGLSATEAQTFKTLELYDQLLYGVAFHKSDGSSPVTTNDSVSLSPSYYYLFFMFVSTVVSICL